MGWHFSGIQSPLSRQGMSPAELSSSKNSLCSELDDILQQVVSEVHSDVSVDLRHVDRHDGFCAAVVDVALACVGVVLSVVHHVFQDLRQNQVEEMVNGGEVELGVEHCCIRSVVPRLLLFWPIVRGVVSEELCREKWNEVDLV